MSLNSVPTQIFTAASVILAATSSFAHAGDQAAWVRDSAPEPGSRYGLFGLLDHRSAYGTGEFPEPMLNDDSDLEEGEIRLNWFRGFKRSAHADEFTLEFEKSIGQLTLEAEFHYEREIEGGDTTEGIGNVDLAARHPIFQYVSPGGFFDTTFGIGVEVGIPTNTIVSQSTEVVPFAFNDLRLGKRLTLQTIVGYSMLHGGEEDGIHTLEYGATLGYAIPHEQLPIPGVQTLIPVFEISGERQLNKEDSGTNEIIGLIGVRANLNAIGAVQPRVGLGYVFPLNETAREEMNWGLFSSLIFEF